MVAYWVAYWVSQTVVLLADHSAVLKEFYWVASKDVKSAEYSALNLVVLTVWNLVVSKEQHSAVWMENAMVESSVLKRAV